MRKKVFIIGNGFDLDLGMNTRYSDFAKSEEWPFKTSIFGLGNYLRRKAYIEKWFDLEHELLIYAINASSSQLDADKLSFNGLSEKLTQYLKIEEQKELDDSSVASQVLHAIIKNGYFESIYSFNYTNLHQIAYKLGIQHDFNYEHVHGSVKDNSIILGIEEETDVRPGYEYMYKTFSPHYESHSIQFDLQEADEVVFFGHSLGHNDYHYFKAFFQSQCVEGMKRDEGKRITFFTYDNNSRIEILKQLRSMNNKKTDLLFNLNQMEFICTNDGGGKKVSTFLKRMEEESRNANECRIDAFETRVY